MALSIPHWLVFLSSLSGRGAASKVSALPEGLQSGGPWALTDRGVAAACLDSYSHRLLPFGNKDREAVVFPHLSTGVSSVVIFSRPRDNINHGPGTAPQILLFVSSFQREEWRRSSLPQSSLSECCCWARSPFLALQYWSVTQKVNGGFSILAWVHVETETWAPVNNAAFLCNEVWKCHYWIKYSD